MALAYDGLAPASFVGFVFVDVFHFFGYWEHLLLYRQLSMKISAASDLSHDGLGYWRFMVALVVWEGDTTRKDRYGCGIGCEIEAYVDFNHIFISTRVRFFSYGN